MSPPQKLTTADGACTLFVGVINVNPVTWPPAALLQYIHSAWVMRDKLLPGMDKYRILQQILDTSSNEVHECCNQIGKSYCLVNAKIKITSKC